MRGGEEIFKHVHALLDTIKKANRLTVKRHGNYVTLERAVFLSWWCDIGDCKFCFMSVQKSCISDPRKARRKIVSILAEAELCKRIGWNIEFLSAGYGSFMLPEIKEIVEMLAYVIERPMWLNIGALGKKSLGIFGDEVEGIIGSVETVDKKLHNYVCPSKPVGPIVEMLREAKEVGFKTGVTIILGLGESEKALPSLFELIEELKLDRVTYYSLNPHHGTPFENHPSPSSLYQAGVIALTRLNFPEINIISGTWIDQLSNIGITVLAGANGITKYPLFSMFGNRYGKKVEEEIKFTSRELLGTFSNMNVLKGKRELAKEKKPENVFNYVRPEVPEASIKRIKELRGDIDRLIENYVGQVEKNIRRIPYAKNQVKK